MPNQTETFTSSREGCSPARGRLGGRERGTATTILLAALLVFTPGCATEPVDDPVDQAPEPIGDELISRVGQGWTAEFHCSNSHLYRDGRRVQNLCFSYDGTFSHENRGTLTPETSANLDAELAAADFDDRTPVNYMGFCDNPDLFGTVTMWAGERGITFEPACLFEGIVPLYAAVETIEEELWSCGEASYDKLESIEPGCQSI
ncbi:hypothetical protein [Enhygromyxa salina]|uniref:Uncharacterized protein n=1 Tax=Enhygromyxa salina TaxID=215803 RepID=A0A2S9YV32_9BACT|nr:hypothetical protein [Enhygromyxa salina]PRQ08965.1 hypothetical protein ENSA7_13640 [Enhygromyxa salina]